MILEDIEYNVRIETPLYSTEDPIRVKQCLSNIFPYVKWEETSDMIKGETKELEKFKTILENMQIRDTARSFMKRKTVDNECKFTLSKQAACNEKINFSEERQPLGGIEVNIESKDLDKLIETLTDTGE